MTSEINDQSRRRAPSSSRGVHKHVGERRRDWIQKGRRTSLLFLDLFTRTRFPPLFNKDEYEEAKMLLLFTRSIHVEAVCT